MCERVGDGVGVAVCEGVGDTVGVVVEEGVSVGVGVGECERVGDGVGVGVREQFHVIVAGMITIVLLEAVPDIVYVDVLGHVNGDIAIVVEVVLDVNVIDEGLIFKEGFTLNVIVIPAVGGEGEIERLKSQL